jgi:hypothetical protein
MVAAGRLLDSFASGPNPRGLAAEVVAASDYRALHGGADVEIVNAPGNLSRNLRDIRVCPDSSSRKDLVFAFDDTKLDGVTIWKPNGQVKTGGSQYVADTLVKMANDPGYGKVGYVDARYVNVDGTPRVAPEAFSPAQARKLQEARVRLRGFHDLEARADRLVANIKAERVDGLDPIARHELHTFRADIAAAYCARGVLVRMAGGAAASAVSAAVVSLLVQRATDGEVDARSLGKGAVIAAGLGAGGVAADAGFYHVGTRKLGLSPEVAKERVRHGVVGGFCVLAVGGDVFSEIRSARLGDVTVTGAIAGTAAKTALDLLPLLAASFGIVGAPVLLGAQTGGRVLIAKAREADAETERAITADDLLAEDLAARMSTFTAKVETTVASCTETDDIFNRVVGDMLRPSLTVAGE